MEIDELKEIYLATLGRASRTVKVCADIKKLTATSNEKERKIPVRILKQLARNAF